MSSLRDLQSSPIDSKKSSPLRAGSLSQLSRKVRGSFPLKFASRGPWRGSYQGALHKSCSAIACTSQWPINGTCELAWITVASVEKEGAGQRGRSAKDERRWKGLALSACQYRKLEIRSRSLTCVSMYLYGETCVCRHFARWHRGWRTWIDVARWTRNLDHCL